MSRENVEVVRRAYEAFSRGDLDTAIADMASDCEYVATGTIPGLTQPQQDLMSAWSIALAHPRGRHVGLDGVTDWLIEQDDT